MAAELSSYNCISKRCSDNVKRLTGWYEKKEKSASKTAAHTRAVRIHAPACAMVAVPVHDLESVFLANIRHDLTCQDVPLKALFRLLRDIPRSSK